jgi:hypothetical protein
MKSSVMHVKTEEFHEVVEEIICHACRKSKNMRKKMEL